MGDRDTASFNDDEVHKEVTQFSDEARKRLREAAEAFAAQVLQHAETLCGMEGRQREIAEIFAMDSPLSEVARRFCDAQFDLTGISPSFDYRIEDDEEEEKSAERIAVLIRHDFLINDREALMAASRAAYLQVRPDDVEDDAEVDVQTVSLAVYQLMHASGEDTILDDVPGLRPTRSVQLTLDVNEPLDFDDPFSIYYGDDK
ncbi:hypothetical protein AB0L65_32185 [Nonomuraea sp. NPDC052116]|uniref:hypothetical protein n=1 Tax=Nonomuraea sp. NPDC052116 TaxID=3155665 RepID=UPI0034202294